MVDQKITELDELTAPAAADELAIVDDSAGATKRISWANLMQGQQNLLTNSGFGVWSNSTLEDVTVVSTDTDGSTYASWAGIRTAMTDGGANLLLTMTATDSGNATYQLSDLTIGKLYEVTAIVANGTGSWTTGDTLRAYNAALSSTIATTSITAAGTYTCVWEATEVNNAVGFSIASGTDTQNYNITSIIVAEVTPGCVAGDTAGPDGMIKAGSVAYPDIYRQHNDTTYTKAGSYYSLKMVSWSSGESYVFTNGNYANLFEISRFAGRTLTMGAWVYASDASNAYVGFYDNGVHYKSGYHSGTPGWEWLEVSRTVIATTSFSGMLGQAVASKTAYFSQPMLVFGSSIGEGNYSSPPGEIIRFEKDVVLTDYDMGVGDIATDVDAEINIEAQSNGKIPKGISELYANIRAMDSAVAASIGVWMGPDTTYCAQNIGDIGVPLLGVGNDEPVQAAGWVRCDSGGDPWVFLNASGANTFDCEIRTTGVRLR
uniref:Uncharacterized protein n=1 Tax=viral metagenome TaxID=1070528 RepID=A0A6M3LR59_9ZZZZ